MKKTSFCFIFLVSSITLFGQAQIRQWQQNLNLTGRMANLDKNTGRSLSLKEVTLIPSVGRWMSLRTLVNMGLSFTYGRQNHEFPENFLLVANNQNFRTGIIFSVRQHFLNTKIRPFLHAQAGYFHLHDKWKYENGTTGSSRENKFGMGMGIGGVYYANKKIAIESMVLYQPFKIYYYDQNFQLSVGIQFRDWKKYNKEK